MPAVHYYLGRPSRVWISAHSPRSPARQARTGSGRARGGIAGQPGGLLARHRIAIARFGTDVAAAGGIDPALAAGLDPAGYPVVPEGVPQAWERAQVYLGLGERYQELYQAQVAELHLLMATAPGCSLPLSHRRPLTDPLTDTHTVTYHPFRARRGAATRTTRPSCISKPLCVVPPASASYRVWLESRSAARCAESERRGPVNRVRSVVADGPLDLGVMIELARHWQAGG
jgi:hypothetical protein